VILVDSSVWIDHFRQNQNDLIIALSERRVVQHPFVTAELALGSVSERALVLAMLGRLPQAPVVSNGDLRDYVEQADLAGTGVGLVDAHLLASSAKIDGLRIWSRDKRLMKQADRLGLAARFRY
jgi:predicted nucleic acid-binding protein